MLGTGAALGSWDTVVDEAAEGRDDDVEEEEEEKDDGCEEAVDGDDDDAENDEDDREDEEGCRDAEAPGLCHGRTGAWLCPATGPGPDGVGSCF